MTQYREAMRLQTVWGKILLAAPEIFPFFLGPIVVGFEYSAVGLSQTISRYLTFLLLFLSWYGVKRFLFDLLDQQASSSGTRSKREKLDLAGAVFCAIATLFFLQFMRLYLAYEAFVVVLAILGLAGLRSSLLRKGRAEWSHLASFIYYTGIGYISMYLVMEVFAWQPAFVALGVACLSLAFEILHLLLCHPETYPLHRKGKILSQGAKILHGVPFLLVCGPSFVAFLSYMNELPKAFGAVFLTLLPSSHIITTIKEAEKSGKLRSGLDQRVAGICILFIVIIAFASYLFF